jgi:hypothetical protein
MSPKSAPRGVSLRGQGKPLSVFDAIATLRAETLRRAEAIKADAIEKVWRVVITAITSEADEAGRGPNKPLDKEHYDR